MKFLAVGCGLNEMAPLANRVVDFSEITTLYKNRLAPPPLQGFGFGGEGAGESHRKGGKVAKKTAKGPNRCQ